MSVMPGKRRLTRDVDISTLRQLRSDGLTNKQIADRLGIAVCTVYRYIGKMSYDVANAEAQNKPSPVQQKVIVEIPTKPQPKAYEIPVEKTPDPDFAMPVGSSLKMKSEVIIWSLEGALCSYEVNKATGEIEMKDGTITGLLDRSTLNTFIDELVEIRQKLTGRKEN